MDSDDFFAQELEGVVPLKNDRVEITKKSIETPGVRVRRRLAVGNLLKEDPLASFEVPPLKSNDILDFKRSGIQNGVFRKFRLGQYEIEARLDLHKLSVDEARREVFLFLKECITFELRTLLSCMEKVIGILIKLPY